MNSSLSPLPNGGALAAHANVAISAGERLGSPIAELDGTCAERAPNVELGYGCVDWFIYIADGSAYSIDPVEVAERA